MFSVKNEEKEEEEKNGVIDLNQKISNLEWEKTKEKKKKKKKKFKLFSHKSH